MNTKIDPEERKEILAEYSALREEIIKRIDIRHNIVIFTLIFAGTFLTLSTQITRQSTLLLLFYPILATFLAALWTQSDIRVSQIGGYIRDNIETKLGGGIGFQKYLVAEFNKRENWLLKYLAEFSVVGIFFITESLAILYAGYGVRFAFSLPELVLFCIDLIGIIFSFSLIRKRRNRYRHIDRQKNIDSHK